MTRCLWIVGLAAGLSAGAVAGDAAAGPLGACLAAAEGRLGFSGVVLVRRGAAEVLQARGTSGSAPLTAGERFNLGSASKMFTAVAVAQLVEGGRIQLDDPVGRFVDGLTPEAGKVTVAQLLTHSSGLGNYFTPGNLPVIARARTLAELKPLVAADKPAFVPGSRVAYSNTGFLLLGLVVERVSGEAYGAYLQKHLFAPAGMTSTSLDPERAAIGLTTMGPGGPGGPLHPAPEAALRGGPAGGAFSTARDLQKFFAALEGGSLLRAETVQRITAPAMVAMPAKDGRPQLEVGLGFGVGRFEGHRWFGNNGGAPGVNAEATVFPDDHLTLIVLANRDPPLATALFREARAMALAPPGAECEAQ